MLTTALAGAALCALVPSGALAAKPGPMNDYCGPYSGIRWMTGMEHGRTGTGGGGIWYSGSDAGGAALADSSVVRSGDYSLRLSPSGAASYRGNVVEMCPIMTVRFAIRLDSAPAADVTELFSVYTSENTSQNGPRGALQLGYDAASGALKARARPGDWQVASTQVVPGAWHVIDLRYDVSTTTNRVDWRVDGVDQAVATGPEAASTVNQFFFGTTFAETFTANYDDMMLAIAPAGDPAWYPYGDGQIYALEPDAMGSSSGPGSFREGNAFGRWSLNSGSWYALADHPIVPDGSFVEQTATAKTRYAEVTFGNTLEATVRAVGAVVTFDPQNTRSTNHGRTAIVVGGTEQTIHDANMAHPDAFLWTKAAVVKKPAGGWTADLVNALRGRVGYSADASPMPRWNSLLVEYEVKRP
ncbi:MAG TPA: hypothetical protein VGW75_13585 [Solirubrobacteraceae bacterium]|nr:hypothetical protein [Solirubrobacteraceae bacterium]